MLIKWCICIAKLLFFFDLYFIMLLTFIFYLFFNWLSTDCILFLLCHQLIIIVIIRFCACSGKFSTALMTCCFRYIIEHTTKIQLTICADYLFASRGQTVNWVSDRVSQCV